MPYNNWPNILKWKGAKAMTDIRKVFFVLSIMWIGILPNLPVYAGPYTDDLTKCVIESTTKTDRIEFIKWMFVAISKHPAVKSLSSVSEEQIRDANEKVAKLFMRLLTDSCKEKAERAIKYEGQIAIKASFQMLGQVAGQELFTDPAVATSLSNLDKYIDVDKLKSSLGIK